MKDNEIKEIELWKEKTKGIFHITEYTRFWNYITNLQQENERLKEENYKSYDQISAIIYNTRLADRQIKDYKSRCEKAIKYIDNSDILDIHHKNRHDLLNILQNGIKMED